MFGRKVTYRTLSVTGVVLATTYCAEGGVLLRIQNAGQDTLYSAVIRTHGHSYSLGLLPPSQADTVTVATNQEGGVYLEHGLRNRKTIELVGYIVPGHRDTIDLRITGDSVVSRKFPK